jgi:hypothetical protein
MIGRHSLLIHLFSQLHVIGLCSSMSVESIIKLLCSLQREQIQGMKTISTQKETVI